MTATYSLTVRWSSSLTLQIDKVLTITNTWPGMIITSSVTTLDTTWVSSVIYKDTIQLELAVFVNFFDAGLPVNAPKVYSTVIGHLAVRSCDNHDSSKTGATVTMSSLCKRIVQQQKLDYEFIDNSMEIRSVNQTGLFKMTHTASTLDTRLKLFGPMYALPDFTLLSGSTYDPQTGYDPRL